MHVDPDVSPEGFEDFPRVRPTLAKWGLLRNPAPRAMSRHSACTSARCEPLAADAKQAIIHHLTTTPTDLWSCPRTSMKASPDGRITRWRNRSPRHMHVKTPFVPSHVQGFVAGDSGKTSLHWVLGYRSRLPALPTSH